MQKIIIGSDHSGVKLKSFLIDYLKQNNFSIIDVGAYTEESCDYPDVANSLATEMKDDLNSFGILICGTGIGMSIAVNRYPFIRGALVYSETTAKLAKEHNDANVLILSARMFEMEENLNFLKIFLKTSFSNEPRHIKRINKLLTL